MRELDRLTIEGGVSGKTLMARAGQGVFEETIEFLEGIHPCHRKKIAVLAGKGNNGGDAFVVAALLAEKTEIPTRVFCMVPKEELHGESRFFAEALPEHIEFECLEDALPRFAGDQGTVIIDGLLGTGFKGRLKAPYPSIIKQLNASGNLVISIDIPSGMNGDNGAITTEAVQADLTVTMAFPKKGMMTPAGLRQCGALRCVDIGILKDSGKFCGSQGEAIFRQDVKPLLGRRPGDGHKGTFGQTLIIGGSSCFAGAPVLSGLAALRAGCGLATIMIPAAIRHLTAGGPHALIFIPAEDEGKGFFNTASTTAVAEAAQNADCIVLGPGIGRAPETQKIVQAILNQKKPVVIDADALKIVAGMKKQLQAAQKVVLTPHPGEMKSLLEGAGLRKLIDAERPLQAAALAAELGHLVVLKGHGTVVADPSGSWSINTSGNSGLASAGSGDVLAGLTGGLIAQGYSLLDATRLAVFVHGLTAEVPPLETRSLIADDILPRISLAFRRLTPFH